MNRTRRHLASLLLLASVFGVSRGVDLPRERQLIPRPVRLVRDPGVFVIRPSTPIVADGQSEPQACLLRELVRSLTRLDLTITRQSPEPAIRLALVSSLPGNRPGAYRLRVQPDQAVLEAADAGGLVSGIQTIAQLLAAEAPGEESGSLPCVTIHDYPRFRWRGLMLDCSRTFQAPDYIRKTIDRLSYYKMNVLHLHLTDDQGWRLEIEKYPDLTRKGATFPARYGEPAAYQGFYSRKEMAALIAYAAARNVTLVPEIEMPGHSLAALSCYPELSCAGGPFEIYPFFRGPGITRDILCAGNDRTFEFIDAVLREVASLFPSRFVHVGGDEAPKDAWKKCPKCQTRMKSEGLRSEEELQGWFMRRVETTLQKYDKQLIGWDEILEGGLAPGAAVMSWRATSGGTAAARAGHDLVMSPTSHCYFDYTYEQINSRRAHSFEPVPEGMSEEEARHILGLQANFWSHIDREPEKVDAQLFSRLLSIAERGWSPRETDGWEEFSRRLSVHLRQLERMGVRFKKEPLP